VGLIAEEALMRDLFNMVCDKHKKIAL